MTDEQRASLTHEERAQEMATLLLGNSISDQRLVWGIARFDQESKGAA